MVVDGFSSQAGENSGIQTATTPKRLALHCIGMDVRELPEYLDSNLTFPTDLETVRAEVGETVLESASTDDELTIAEVLSHLETEEYNSAEELFESVQANLPEEYIGRKGYTDRGTSDPEADGEPVDEEDQSF